MDDWPASETPGSAAHVLFLISAESLKSYLIAINEGLFCFMEGVRLPSADVLVGLPKWRLLCWEGPEQLRLKWARAALESQEEKEMAAWRVRKQRAEGDERYWLSRLRHADCPFERDRIQQRIYMSRFCQTRMKAPQRPHRCSQCGCC